MLPEIHTNPTMKDITKADIEDDILQSCKSKIRRTKTITKLDPNQKPIMAPELEEEVEAALVQYTQRHLWKDWGMDYLGMSGAAVLFEGPCGTGKTTIARYMSKRVGKGILPLNMKDVGGKAPGHTERMISEHFDKAKIDGNKTIFIDECEAILWDRSKAGSDSMWMVGVIDELLMRVAEYKGLIIFATNRPEIVDPALKDRCFAVLQIPMPEYKQRLALWKQKIPTRFPLHPTTAQLEQLATLQMSGRQIENTIKREASFAIRGGRKPTFASMLSLATQSTHNK